VADFVVSRFVRLWPTALLCGFLTWIATKSLGPDIFERSFYEYLVSITFMPPRYIGGALGHPEWRWIDGAYWSLWTEVRFYAVAAFIFFLSRRSITIGWMLFAFASFLLHLAFLSVPSGMLDHASGLVFTEYQPYFTVGIGLALWRKGTDNRAATLFVAFGIAQAFLYECLIPAFKNPATPHLIERFIGLIVVFVLPYCALWRTSIVNFLSFSAIVKLGQASYVFYLLHQNFGIALYKYVNAGDGPANPLWTLPLFAVIALLSLFLHARFEVPVMVRLSKMLKGSRDSKKPSHD
jgi:peptidoglycan/LPS O-acetylase OafA/YrhL